MYQAKNKNVFGSIRECYNFSNLVLAGWEISLHWQWKNVIIKIITIVIDRNTLSS